MLSPEQLDQLISITKPRDWIAIVGLCAVLIMVGIWGIFGRVVIDLAGPALLLRPGGYRIIETASEGFISKIKLYHPGDRIVAGEVVAEMEHPVLALQIEAAQSVLSALYKEKETPEIRLKIAEAQSRVVLLQKQLKITSMITSPYTGNFLAYRANKGAYLQSGSSLLSMEDAGTVSGVIFLPPSTTNIDVIQSGMLVKMFPGISRDSSFGYILGRVKRIARFPASPQVMMNLINNQGLVDFLSRQGPPYLVYVDFIADPNTVSGFKWSSVAGKNFQIQSGTLCTALIQIASEPPINLVIPHLRKPDA